MNATTGPASPLPEGRADGRAAEFVCVHGKRVTDHYCVDMLGNDVAPVPACRHCGLAVYKPEPAEFTQWVHVSNDDVRCMTVAAPVVAVPEAGERLEKCPACGHPLAHHMAYYGCYCGCRGRITDPAPVVGEREEKP